MLNREEDVMLIGSFEHMLDAKGRVFIPAKWRETIGETMIVTEGLLGTHDVSCLFVMSLAEWEAFSEKLSKLPITDMAGQTVRRKLYAMAAACETDKQGRILIPGHLRERADLTKDATLIGVGNRIEIWNPAQLAAHEKNTEAGFEAALSHLAELGI